MIRKALVAMLAPAFVLSSAASAFALTPDTAAPPAPDAPVFAPPPAPGADEHGGFNLTPTHHYQWAPSDAKNAQLGVNFGLLQLALGGFNAAVELRYRRFWFEYSHGMDLKLNNLNGFSMSQTERDQNLRVYVPYTTGFGVGMTLVDELWLGVEFKTHRYEVNAPAGPVTSYQTYSIGPVLGYKAFIYKGLFADAYLRYWPNVASSLDGNKVALQGTDGTVEHSAHDFGVFANVSIGYAFDL
jgi:hypothetical protein